MALVNRKYIKTVAWSKLSEFSETLINDCNFRILEIIDYCDVGTEKLNIKESNIRKLFNESSNLFLLIFETSDQDVDKKIFERVIYDFLKSTGKYFLIEIYDGMKTILRFIFNGETITEFSNKQLTNFVQIVDDPLLLSRLNVSAFDYLKSVSCKSSSLDCILIRLIKIFDFVYKENVEAAILKNLVDISDVNALRAYLDLPVTDDGKAIKPTALTIKAVEYKYEDDATLLFFAAVGDTNMLSLLLRLGADVYAQKLCGETASDHTGTNDKNLKLLLDYDARYPRYFQQTYDKFLCSSNDGIQKELLEMCVERQNFHEAIIEGNKTIIDKFEEKFPLLKFVYTFINEEPYSRAATTTALKEAIRKKKDDYEMYSYLIGKGFSIDDNDLHFMTIADRNQVSAIHLDRIKTEQSSHIAFLRSKTFVNGVNINEQFKYKQKIKKIYGYLNDFTELENILKIVEHSKSLTVSIDFQNKSVIYSDLAASNCVDGLTYYNFGRIYLGVADKNDKEIAGILIHELTHFALHIIFNNYGRPYHTFDETNKSLFHEIVENVKKCLENLPEDQDLAKVFRNVYISYSNQEWPKELIARAPQLIAMGLSGTESCKEITELFTFYRKNILPCMEKLTSNPEEFFIKRQVYQLNEYLRHAQEIEKWQIQLHQTLLTEALCNGRDVRKVICDIPRLFLCDFYEEAVIKNHKYVLFASVKDFVNSFTSSNLQQIWNLTSRITLVLDVDGFIELGDTFQTKFIRMLKNKETSKNIVAFGKNQETLNSIFDAKEQCTILKYTWKHHLKSSYRKTLLMKKINFQGALVPLNKLIDDDFDSIPMEKLINDEEIIISMPLIDDDYDEQTFVERGFRREGQECSMAEILSIATKSITTVLLSGYPGSGQSIMMSRIAITLKDKQHNPLFWVANVNLKQLILACRDIADASQTKFYSKHFLELESDFELSLFEKLYDNSQVIFLFDSVVDLPYDCIERALLLLETLSHKNRLWITVHRDSPLQEKIAKVVSDKIVLEFQALPFDDHVAYVIKIWQKHLQLFDQANEFKFKSYAEKLLRNYKDFIGIPKLTFLIANKYVNCVTEYSDDGDGSLDPENIYINSDIYDLHKDLYSQIIQRRHTDDASNVAASVILRRNMFTAFEQFIDFFLEMHEADESNKNGRMIKMDDTYEICRTMEIAEINEMGEIVEILEGKVLKDKPLQMYANGADDLLRNGIINFEYHLSPIGNGAFFFLSNYIVQSMESTFKMFGFLCKNIVDRESKLIKFIEGRMKDSPLFQIDFTKSSFTQPWNYKLYPPIGHDDLLYLLNENAVLLLCFILRILEKSQLTSQRLEPFFTNRSIFSSASEKCLRCIIDILWNISNELFIEYITMSNPAGCNPFQNAFMNFPENDLDVVRDISQTFDLSNALRSQEAFNEKLNKSTLEKYSESTLGFYVNLILERMSAEKINELIYQYSTPSTVSKYKISGKHFEEVIERKWTAMQLLKFPTTDWIELTTKTVFENIVSIIFNELNNDIVMKFYKWAETKVAEVDTFNKFVANTFVTFFGNCVSEKHGKEIITFVQSRINIGAELEQHIIEVLNQMSEQKADLQEKFTKKISIYRSLLTEKQFENLLFKKVGNDNRNLISRICVSCNEETIYQTFSAVSLEKIMEETELNWYFIYALMVYMVGKLDEFRDDTSIKCITDFICKKNRVIVSNALTVCTNEGTFFHLAFLRRDMLMVQRVWKMAKDYLDEKQFRCQLLDKFGFFPYLIENATASEFLHQPPRIHNTNCQTACFEFQPFKPNGEVVPKFAIPLDDKLQIYIGRCKLLNADGYALCKIIPNTCDPIQLIEVSGMQQLENSLEIMIGKGLQWTKHTDTDNQQIYFRFKEKLLMKRRENVILVDCACVGQFYLAYDDGAAVSSEIVTGFCYRQGIQIL